MNVLEQIEAYLDCGMGYEQAAELVGRACSNPQDYYDGLPRNTLYFIDIAGDIYHQTPECEEWSLCEIQLGNILANCSNGAKFLPIGYANEYKRNTHKIVSIIFY